MGHRIAVLLVAAGAAALWGGSAAAQERSAGVFQRLFQVDVAAGNQGSVGCAGAGGGELSTRLNEARDEDITEDTSTPFEVRRDLFRLCDATTNSTANGWTGQGDSDPAKLRDQATSFAPEELFAGVDHAAAVFDVQASNVAQRLARLRVARRAPEAGPVLAGLPRPERSAVAAEVPGLGASLLDRALAEGTHLQVGGSDGGGPVGASGEGAPGLGLFANGRFHRVDIEENSAESGSLTTGGGVTLGGDLRFGGLGHAGLAFGYTHLDTRFDDTGSESELDSYSFSAYGAIYPTEELYVDATLTGTIHRLENENQVLIFDAGPSLGSLEGDTEGWSVGASAGAGLELPAGPVTVGPFFRGDVVHTEFDSFSQRGGDGSLDLRIDSQRNTSVTTQLGSNLSLALSTEVAVVSPHLRAAWVHEYADQADDVEGSLLVLPEAAFVLEPTDVDRDYATVGGGVSATFPGGFSQFVDYEAVVGFAHVITHQITLGLRLEL